MGEKVITSPLGTIHVLHEPEIQQAHGAVPQCLAEGLVRIGSNGHAITRHIVEAIIPEAGISST